MMKRIIAAVSFLLALTTSAFSAGTISFSLSQQFDSLGKPLAGCRLYFYQAGTTATPQNAYQDSGLTNALPNPLECDAAGRLPQFYLDDGQIKIRLTDKNGVTQVTADNLLVIGPSSGGGGGGGDVDPTTIFETGAIKAKYGTGSLSGWVRLNGRTIGSATSGATERANADTQALFEYLWGADSSLTVSGGRGATASADWSANKSIALPDFRSRALAGLGDMGNSDNALFDGLTFTRGDATSLGSLVGASKTTMAQANLPSVNFNVTASGQPKVVSGQNAYGIAEGSSPATTVQGGTGSFSIFSSNQFTSIAPVTVTGTAASGGSGTAMSTVSPFALVTMYIKL